MARCKRKWRGRVWQVGPGVGHGVDALSLRRGVWHPSAVLAYAVVSSSMLSPSSKLSSSSVSGPISVSVSVNLAISAVKSRSTSISSSESIFSLKAMVVTSEALFSRRKSERLGDNRTHAPQRPHDGLWLLKLSLRPCQYVPCYRGCEQPTRSGQEKLGQSESGLEW